MSTRKIAAKLHRRHRAIIKYGTIAIVVLLIGIQFIPTGFDLDPPPVKQEPNWDSAETRMLVKRACYDCHAHETGWPWYSKIAPFSWALQYDIQAGLKTLNFSEWDQSEWDEEDLDRFIELVAKDQMPLPYYLILHPEAQLTNKEKGQMINGMIATTTDLGVNVANEVMDADPVEEAFERLDQNLEPSGE